MNKFFDVAIVGGGAVGLSCACQIKNAAPSLSICIIEKEADTAFGTSGRNSAVVHAGFNNPVGSLKAKLCVEGSLGFEKLAAELGIEYRKTGKVVVGFSDEDRKALEKLLAQGKANGVEDLEIIDKEQIASLSPHIKGSFALYSPSTAIFNPFTYCTALAKKAFNMGVTLLFSTEVVKIHSPHADDSLWRLTSEKTHISEKNTFEKEVIDISARLVVNSAGLNSGQIAQLASTGDFDIRPCRGEYHILEKEASNLIKIPVYPVPNEEKNVLGIHITPTTDGKVMYGPSAEFIDDRSDYSTTSEVMKMLKDDGSFLCPELQNISTIRSFSGIRPKCDANGGDFIIEESRPGFINLVGIESPGITASMPIGRKVSEMVFSSSAFEQDGYLCSEAIASREPQFVCSNPTFESGDYSPEENNPGLNCTPSTVECTGAVPESYSTECGDLESIVAEVSIHAPETKSENQNNSLICRCEGVTASDILKAFDEIREIGAIPTIKGLKNRTGAFMGLCQGGFCTVDTANLLEKERSFSPSLLTYDGPESEMFDKNTRLK